MTFIVITACWIGGGESAYRGQIIELDEQKDAAVLGELVRWGRIVPMTPANATKFGADLRVCFTEREREILSLLHLADKGIAARLRISVHTVHAHTRSIYVKLGSHTRTAVALLWQQWGAIKG